MKSLKKIIVKVSNQKFILLLILPLISLAVAFGGLYYLQKLADMQALERDHIELLWKNKYHLNRYVETNDEKYIQLFFKDQNEMQTKPEKFIDMVTWLDRMVLPNDMENGTYLCAKDIKDQESWVEIVEDYHSGKLSKEQYMELEENIFNESKENSYGFHELFGKVQGKVESLVTGLILIINIILMIATYRICIPMRKNLDLLNQMVERVAQGNLEIIENKFGEDEVGALANTVNGMTFELRRLISEIAQNSTVVKSYSGKLKFTVEQINNQVQGINVGTHEIVIRRGKRFHRRC